MRNELPIVIGTAALSLIVWRLEPIIAGLIVSMLIVLSRMMIGTPRRSKH